MSGKASSTNSIDEGPPPDASPESSPDDPQPTAMGIPGRTYVEAETPSTAKPDDRPMWPNGDNFEFGAYRARCVAVTG